MYSSGYVCIHVVNLSPVSLPWIRSHYEYKWHMFPVESLGFYIASNLTRIEKSCMESNLAKLRQLSCNYPKYKQNPFFSLPNHLENRGPINWWSMVIGIIYSSCLPREPRHSFINTKLTIIYVVKMHWGVCDSYENCLCDELEVIIVC